METMREIQTFDNGYPHFEKGQINWRLYIRQGIFSAAKTKEATYEKTEHDWFVSLPPLQEIPLANVQELVAKQELEEVPAEALKEAEAVEDEALREVNKLAALDEEVADAQF